jgi:hypothetical protein
VINCIEGRAQGHNDDSSGVAQHQRNVGTGHLCGMYMEGRAQDRNGDSSGGLPSTTEVVGIIAD